jgi:hypothetical protein
LWLVDVMYLLVNNGCKRTNSHGKKKKRKKGECGVVGYLFDHPNLMQCGWGFVVDATSAQQLVHVATTTAT